LIGAPNDNPVDASTEQNPQIRTDNEQHG